MGSGRERIRSETRQLLISFCRCKDRLSGSTAGLSNAINASLAAALEDTRRVAPLLRGLSVSPSVADLMSLVDHAAVLHDLLSDEVALTR